MTEITQGQIELIQKMFESPENLAKEIAILHERLGQLKNEVTDLDEENTKLLTAIVASRGHLQSNAGDWERAASEACQFLTTALEDIGIE